MMSVTRRTFLKISGAATGVGASAVAGIANAAPATSEVIGATTLPYPRAVVARRDQLPVNTAVSFNYPDGSSPCAVIKMGHAVPGGVGPDQDIVAYSTQCTHMGCPVIYDPQSKTFKCPCHFSLFDAEIGGQMVCGQATEDLPQLVLEYDGKTGAVVAVGITGKIYGRQSNML